MSISVRAMTTGLLLSLGGSGLPTSASAMEKQTDIVTECQQEAMEYGVAAEQEAEYVDGCIQSRGGYLEPPPRAGVPGIPDDAGSPPADLPVDGLDEPAGMPESGNETS